MVRSDYFDDYRNLPEYYPTMYKDGFTPQQIFAAFEKKLQKKEKERRRAMIEAAERQK